LLNLNKKIKEVLNIIREQDDEVKKFEMVYYEDEFKEDICKFIKNNKKDLLESFSDIQPHKFNLYHLKLTKYNNFNEMINELLYLAFKEKLRQEFFENIK